MSARSPRIPRNRGGLLRLVEMTARHYTREARESEKPGGLLLNSTRQAFERLEAQLRTFEEHPEESKSEEAAVAAFRDGLQTAGAALALLDRLDHSMGRAIRDVVLRFDHRTLGEGGDTDAGS